MTYAYSPVSIINYQWNNPDWGDLNYQYRITLFSYIYPYDQYRNSIQRNKSISVSVSTVISNKQHTMVHRVSDYRLQFYCNDLDWLMIAKFSDCGQELLARIQHIDCRVTPLKPYDSNWVWEENHLPTMG